MTVSVTQTRARAGQLVDSASSSAAQEAARASARGTDRVRERMTADQGDAAAVAGLAAGYEGRARGPHTATLRPVKTFGDAGSREIQSRLKEFQRKVSDMQLDVGEGRKVGVAVPFRMAGGSYYPKASEATERLKAALPADEFRKIAPSLGKVLSAKGTPEEIRQVTQTLIDNGALDGFIAQYHGDERAAIRGMMHYYGIGLDCSGYSLQAICYAKKIPMQGSREGWPVGSKPVDPKGPWKGLLSAEPGDWIQLDVPENDTAGHKVVCRSHTILPKGRPLPPGLPYHFGKLGSVHVFEVDSSWGGGDSRGQSGGVDKRTWIYDEATGQWASSNADGSFEVADQPYDHPVLGVWRAPKRR